MTQTPELKVGDRIRSRYAGVIDVKATITAIDMNRIFPFTVHIDEVDPLWVEYIEVGETRSLFSAEILAIIT